MPVPTPPGDNSPRICHSDDRCPCLCLQRNHIASPLMPRKRQARCSSPPPPHGNRPLRRSTNRHRPSPYGAFQDHRNTMETALFSSDFWVYLITLAPDQETLVFPERLHVPEQ